MLETHVYVQVDNPSPKESSKQYGYILECSIRGEIWTKEGFGRVKGTYHKATLTAVAEALARFKKPCRIHIHSEDEHVIGAMARHLGKWANNCFMNSRGKPVANHEEWIKVWTLMQNHEIVPVLGKHAYTSWLQNEMAKENDNV